MWFLHFKTLSRLLVLSLMANMSLAVASELTAGLSSLHVPVVYPNLDNKIGYFPAHIQFVDQHALNRPQIIALGNKSLITGRFSLIAVQTEVDKLRQRVKQKYGAATKLVQISPKGFAMQLLIEDKIVWQRSLARGSFKRIPIQLLIASQKSGQVVEATLKTTMTWTEKLQPLAAKLRFDWQAVVKLFQTQLEITTLLTEKTLTKVAKQALAAQLIVLERQSDTPQANLTARLLDWIVNEFKQQLLEKYEKPAETPRPHFDQNAMRQADHALLSWTVSYRMRESVRTESLNSVHNLNVISYRERVDKIISKMLIPF
ncbi:MAG: hypothetical protein DRR00_09135 [Candidatus Parabeggiatoa sp. nov. 3]|nr:MAG: hypothetical protein DRR00_09135 [Gammaproteobacteria bacterium]HEW98462.1 hypothetical protein [Beggiatoa sp.]